VEEVTLQLTFSNKVGLFLNALDEGVLESIVANIDFRLGALPRQII